MDAKTKISQHNSVCNSVLYSDHSMNVSLEDVDEQALQSRFPTVTVGQGWTPTNCNPKFKIAIIVPFRDREAHLRIFLSNLIPFLQLQQNSFQVFIIDQVSHAKSKLWQMD